MNYRQCYDLVDFINRRFAKAGMLTRYYQWGIEITWDKLIKWGKMLGYKGGSK